MTNFHLRDNFIPLVLLLAIVLVNIAVSIGLKANSITGLTSTHVFTVAFLEVVAIVSMILMMRHRDQKTVI